MWCTFYKDENVLNFFFEKFQFHNPKPGGKSFQRNILTKFSSQRSFLNDGFFLSYWKRNVFHSGYSGRSDSYFFSINIIFFQVNLYWLREEKSLMEKATPTLLKKHGPVIFFFRISDAIKRHTVVLIKIIQFRLISKEFYFKETEHEKLILRLNHDFVYKVLKKGLIEIMLTR